MSRRCSICTHEQRAAIDAALIAGQSYRKISKRFGVSRSTLGRHFRQHLLPLLAERSDVDPDDLLAQLEELRRQAQAIKDRAEAEGDLRTALQGIRELVRIVELLAKIRGELAAQPTVNVLLSPQWVTVRTVLLKALRPFPEARAAAAAALLEVDGRET